MSNQFFFFALVVPPWTSIAPLRTSMYSDYSNMSAPEQLVAEERVQQQHNYTFRMDKFHQITRNFSEPKYYLGKCEICLYLMV